MKNSFFSYLCLAVVLLSYTSAGAQQKAKDQPGSEPAELASLVGERIRKIRKEEGLSAQHYLQLRPYAVHWRGWCSSLLKNRPANIPFWKRCKVKSWGLYRNRLQKPENGAGEAMQSQKSASAKRKAPYFLRSTVLFWWRIAGSNRWPLACHASALPAELNPQMCCCRLTTCYIIATKTAVVNRFWQKSLGDFEKTARQGN